MYTVDLEFRSARAESNSRVTMIIRESQIDELERHAQQNFRSRLAAYLRTHLPDQTRTMNDNQLDETIREAQAQAEPYGIVSERGIAKWCYLYLALGSAFHRQHETNEYLRRDVPRPDQKVDNLMRALAIRLQSREANA